MFETVMNQDSNTNNVQAKQKLRKCDSPSECLSIQIPRKSKHKKFIHDCDTNICSTPTTNKSLFNPLKPNRFERYCGDRAMFGVNDPKLSMALEFSCFVEDEWEISEYADSEELNKASIGMSFRKSDTNSDISSFLEEDLTQPQPGIKVCDAKTFQSGFLTKSSSCSMVSESLQEDIFNQQQESSEDTIEQLMKHSRCFGIDFGSLRLQALQGVKRRSFEAGDSVEKVDANFEGKLHRGMKVLIKDGKFTSKSCRHIEYEGVFRMDICGHFANEKILYRMNEGFLEAPGRMVKFCPECA